MQLFRAFTGHALQRILFVCESEHTANSLGLFDMANLLAEIKEANKDAAAVWILNLFAKFAG